MRRRMPVVAVAAMLLLVLAGCSGLPVSGPVQPGLAPDEDATVPDVVFIPDPPQAGATPAEIVAGFLRAGSGSADNWARAMLYLAPDVDWVPDAGVTIDRLADREVTEVAPGRVDVSLVAEAVVDSTGAYAPVEPGAPASPLPFELAQQDDGEWRITSAPDGIVLNAELFERVFQPVTLEYFDASGDYLVPDLRWYPRVNAATRIALALVDGEPSPWLAESVDTAFPSAVSLAADAVPIVDDVARVDLTDDALDIDPATLARMQTQLQTSMASAGIRAVQMSVDSTALPGEAAAVRSTRIDSRPLVELADGTVGFLAGDEVEDVPGLSAVIEAVGVDAIETSADLESAALRTDAGDAAWADADGAIVVDQRDGLLAPSLDGSGYVWTVPRDDPGGLRASTTDGEVVALVDAWPGASEVAALQLSRDGTRLVAIASVGGHLGVWVHAIVRDDDGAPVSLGEGYLIADLTGRGDGVDVTWLDAATVGVLVRGPDATSLVSQPVGGRGTSLTAPAGAIAVEGGNQVSTLRVLAEGVLYVRRGSTWVQSAEVSVLGTQQGSPL